MATKRIVDERDLTNNKSVKIGDIFGRHAFCNANGREFDRWHPASASDSIEHGWGESWDNACRTTGPLALYRVTRLFDRPIAGAEAYLSLRFVELECIKAAN